MPKGIIVTSPIPRSGKTFLCAGLAGSMLSTGLGVEAVKPYTFSTDNKDQDYYVHVTKRQPYYDNIYINDWSLSNKGNWGQLIKICKNMAYPVLLESPGSAPAPLSFETPVLDVTDLSKALEWPVILVASATLMPYEFTTQAIALLKLKETNILGFVLTCSEKIDDIKHIEDISTKIALNYGVSCLGIIPFSPSISVENLKQGNNIKLVENYVDLHPVQTELNPVLIM